MGSRVAVDREKAAQSWARMAKRYRDPLDPLRDVRGIHPHDMERREAAARDCDRIVALLKGKR